jgi:hypothetical protein
MLCSVIVSGVRIEAAMQKGRVLRAADRYASFDWIAAMNAKFVHVGRLRLKCSWCECKLVPVL